MTHEETVRDELEWQRQRYERSSSKLDRGDIPEDRVPITLGGLGKKARSIAVCKLVLEESEVPLWLDRSAEHLLEKVDKVEEYEAVLDGSYRINRPTHCMEALHAAILCGSDEYVEKAIEKVDEIDQRWHRKEHPEVSHVLFYVLALSAYLDGDEEAAREWLDDLEALDHGVKMTGGRGIALAAILAGDEQQLTEGVEQILDAHFDEYCPSPDTAVGFLSIDAAVFVVLAERAGLEIHREEIEDALLPYLVDSVPA